MKLKQFGSHLSLVFTETQTGAAKASFLQKLSAESETGAGADVKLLKRKCTVVKRAPSSKDVSTNEHKTKLDSTAATKREENKVKKESTKEK